jgi:hypothetical protein
MSKRYLTDEQIRRLATAREVIVALKAEVDGDRTATDRKSPAHLTALDLEYAIRWLDAAAE